MSTIGGKCPGCKHNVLLRAADGTCGEKECRDYVAALARGEAVIPPHVIERERWSKKLLESLQQRYPERLS
jgi:hypothetical protein